MEIKHDMIENKMKSLPNERKLREISFRKRLTYQCVIYSPIEFYPLCVDLYKVISLSFFMRYSHLKFLDHYLTFSISNFFKQFDYYSNKKSNLLSHFKK